MASVRRRQVFLLSDRTGITVEALGHSLLTQFDGVTFELFSRPYLDSLEKIEKVCQEIELCVRQDLPPLVFSTLLQEDLRQRVAVSGGIILDFFQSFLPPLEQALQQPSLHVSGRSHGIVNDERYFARIDSLNFALGSDDGLGQGGYSQAEIILVGVSRSGKTPSCLYLALHYGILAANFPITGEALDHERLPEVLQPFRKRLFALTINAERLRQIRNQRLPHSRYASYAQCRREVAAMDALIHQEGLRALDASHMSIEEIATSITEQAGLQRRPVFS